LIVFTPKSLLRHADAISALQELAQSAFQPILDDPDAPDPAKVSRLVFCSGRVYYDLAKARRDKQLSHIALIRVEQLYPVADLEFQALLARYAKAGELVWAQDEPRNQGPWRFMAHHLARFCKTPLIYAGRPESSAPATGIASLHKKQLEEILAIALD
jgi:2-oxoglutarate dehydrogenase E1 component